ncbi:NUDIX hydrolase [Pseudokineococcus sp. 1T1Z-3]|uniref:NUDIX hydrolase n=1 Tax=Pseudokineococcus sp. 1T1Z-3 TaxID=3132745 RepID=UPI003099DCDB
MSGGAAGAAPPREAASVPGVVPAPAGLPWWVRDLVAGAPRAAQALAGLGRVQAGTPSGRREGRAAAVLVCLSPGSRAVPAPKGGAEPLGDLLLLERAAGLRAHAGQPALPGGALDPGDDGPVAAALREAQEETRLDVAGVQVLATMPALRVPPDGFAVTPVLAWEPVPSPVAAGDPGEVVRVLRVPVAEMLDPSRRVRVTWDRRLPGAGGGEPATLRGEGPGFDVGPRPDAGARDGAGSGVDVDARDGSGAGLLVWGFTAALVSALLDAAGLAPGWEGARVVPAPALRPALDPLPPPAPAPVAAAGPPQRGQAAPGPVGAP